MDSECLIIQAVAKSFMNQTLTLFRPFISLVNNNNQNNKLNKLKKRIKLMPI